jgi:hypothetical protein
MMSTGKKSSKSKSDFPEIHREFLFFGIGSLDTAFLREGIFNTEIHRGRGDLGLVDVPNIHSFSGKEIACLSK